MDVLPNRQNKTEVCDATFVIGIRKNTEKEIPTILEHNAEESLKNSPHQPSSMSTNPESFHSTTSEDASEITDSLDSTLDVITNDVTTENSISVPTQNTRSDLSQTTVENLECITNASKLMLVPMTKVEICDESNRSDLCNSEKPETLNISAVQNETIAIINENDNIIIKTISSEVSSRSVTLNISDVGTVAIVSECIPVGVADRQDESHKSDTESSMKVEGSEIVQNDCEEPSSSVDMEALSVNGGNKNLVPALKIKMATTDAICNLKHDLPAVNSTCTETEEENNNLNYSQMKVMDLTPKIYVPDIILPDYLNVLLEGMHVCGDSRRPIDSKPEWFDVDKFYRGQQVAMRYLFGLVFAEMLSLLMILSFPDGLTPLIFTGKSDTPFKSFNRYLTTVARVRSWYVDDIWKSDTEGHKNLKLVRNMHEAVRQRLHSTKSNDLLQQLTVAGKFKAINQQTSVWSPLHKIVTEDFQGSCPQPHSNQCPFVGYRENRVFINQMDMAVTQFGFVGLFILFPNRLGAHGVTDEDLDGFVHLWRCLGYLLGLEDRYNFCNGDLETVRKRSRDLIRFWVKPSLRKVSRDWEHMTRCIVEGISYYVSGVTFEVSLLYLCDLLGIYAPRLSATLTFTQRLLYHLTSFTLSILLRLPGSVHFYNWLLRVSIKRAQMFSPEWLRKLEQKKYPFEQNTTYTRL